MAKTISFNFAKAIPAAWDFCWNDNLKRRAAYAARGDSYAAKQTYYLTASDVENQVRNFAQDQWNGDPWGTCGRAWGRGWSTLRITGDLKNAVRDWLLHNRDLDRHNFGRGHISGMRFRPRGEPMGEAEQRTMEAKAKRAANPRPQRVHFRVKDGFRALCLKPRSLYSCHRSQAYATANAADVTCKACLNLMAKEQQ